MPEVRVLIYADAGNVAPLRTFLLEKRFPAKASDKFVALLQRLRQFGSELKRPTAAPLREGIYELRADHQNVEYRILYFFDGRGIAVATHAIVKSGWKVPPKEIDVAVARMKAYLADRARHTYVQPETETDVSARESTIDGGLREVGRSIDAEEETDE